MALPLAFSPPVGTRAALCRPHAAHPPPAAATWGRGTALRLYRLWDNVAGAAGLPRLARTRRGALPDRGRLCRSRDRAEGAGASGVCLAQGASALSALPLR